MPTHAPRSSRPSCFAPPSAARFQSPWWRISRCQRCQQAADADSQVKELKPASRIGCGIEGASGEGTFGGSGLERESLVHNGIIESVVIENQRDDGYALTWVKGEHHGACSSVEPRKRHPWTAHSAGIGIALTASLHPQPRALARAVHQRQIQGAGDDAPHQFVLEADFGIERHIRCRRAQPRRPLWQPLIPKRDARTHGETGAEAARQADFVPRLLEG